MPRLRRADCSLPGTSAGVRAWLRLLRGWRSTPDRSRDPGPHPPALVIPPAWKRRVDLPLAQRPPPGGGNGRRRAHASTATTTLAGRRDQEKFDHMLDFARASAQLRSTCARAPGRRATGWHASGCWPAPCACSTWASSGSGPRATPSRTRPRAGHHPQGPRRPWTGDARSNSTTWPSRASAGSRRWSIPPSSTWSRR